jgi:hypothetical protein
METMVMVTDQTLVVVVYWKQGADKAPNLGVGTCYMGGSCGLILIQAWSSWERSSNKTSSYWTILISNSIFFYFFKEFLNIDWNSFSCQFPLLSYILKTSLEFFFLICQHLFSLKKDKCSYMGIIGVV